MLFQCFQTLKLYGKEPESFDSIISMFNLVLADYPMEEIRKAFAFYLKANNEMPAPADIANIIERKGRPPLERSVYVNISRKDAENRTSKEWEYMREYEHFQLTGEY